MKCIWLGYMNRIHWGVCKCITFQYVLFHRKFWVVQKTCTCWAMPASLGLAFASCYITNNFSTRMQILGKIGFTVTPLQGIISLPNVAPATAVHLSCHVHNFIATTCIKLHHLSIEFELWLKNCLWNGPQVCVALLASEGHLALITQIYIRRLTGCSRPLATLEAVHLNNLVQRELNVDFFAIYFLVTGCSGMHSSENILPQSSGTKWIQTNPADVLSCWCGIQPYHQYGSQGYLTCHKSEWPSCDTVDISSDTEVKQCTAIVAYFDKSAVAHPTDKITNACKMCSGYSTNPAPGTWK